ncbi:hypothetical protein PIB30_004816 [Stylosanthes scabra]|uniref:Uncharacterized protein n=1 Tax=Stylosanthes scabra TaxID=79078 RepID=A0ABU6U3L5_9FABA|nr:hypothetical protein [Stylosanthes scabra]
MEARHGPLSKTPTHSSYNGATDFGRKKTPCYCPRVGLWPSRFTVLQALLPVRHHRTATRQYKGQADRTQQRQRRRRRRRNIAEENIKEKQCERKEKGASPAASDTMSKDDGTATVARNGNGEGRYMNTIVF